MNGQAQVYSRIIHTLQQINGQSSVLSDIRAMRSEINSLQHEASLELSRLSTSRTKLNYHVKPEPRRSPGRHSP
jgi:hypothetical protein